MRTSVHGRRSVLLVAVLVVVLVTVGAVSATIWRGGSEGDREAARTSGGGSSGEAGPSSATASLAGPSQLAGLDLVARESGATALVEVEQLHGKALGPAAAQAWVGHYGHAGQAEQATVWITRSADTGEAESLFTRMRDRIGQGRSPFQLMGPISEQGVRGYELDGMGQKHFYYLSGRDLYWLAIEPGRAQTGLRELVIFGASEGG